MSPPKPAAMRMPASSPVQIPAAWFLGLDTSLRGTDSPVIHLFYLNPPRVNVVMHFCGSEVASTDDLNALGSLAAQVLTCPAVARTTEGGSADFGVTVADGNWGARGLDAATFDPTVICESDLGDWTGDSSDNACVDAPTYRFDQTAQGYVTVTQDYAPAGLCLRWRKQPGCRRNYRASTRRPASSRWIRHTTVT